MRFCFHHGNQSQGMAITTGTLIINSVGRSPRDIFAGIRVPRNKKFDMSNREIEFGLENECLGRK